MIDHNKPFAQMTIEEISAELKEHFASALADPVDWNQLPDAKESFDPFADAATAIHDLLHALQWLRYGDAEPPWSKAKSDA